MTAITTSLRVTAVFFFNGGRLYLDMGHVEYGTPECLSRADIVAYDQVGEVLIQQALQELHLASEVSFIKNNIDHYTRRHVWLPRKLSPQPRRAADPSECRYASGFFGHAHFTGGSGTGR